MARILTGIQSTGTPHLGNILGAIMPAVKMANDPSNESFLFIADYHALTSVRDADALRQMTTDVALDFLAAGLDPDTRTQGGWRGRGGGSVASVLSLEVRDDPMAVVVPHRSEPKYLLSRTCSACFLAASR